MVKTMGPYPLFWYIYSPRISQGRRKTDSQRFNVALYSDGSLVYNELDEYNRNIGCSYFQLPTEVTDGFLQMLQCESWWLRTLPLHLRSQQAVPDYSSMFGFAGHPLFICDELLKMRQLADDDRNGVYARRLHVVFEFIAEMLYDHGVMLMVDRVKWDWRKIQPLPQEEAAARMLAFTEQQSQFVQTAAVQ